MAGLVVGGITALLKLARFRISAYLQPRLRLGTQKRYEHALDEFDAWCSSASLQWDDITFDDQDQLLAYHCLEDLFEADGGGWQKGADLVAALQKCYPGYKYRLSSKVLQQRKDEHPGSQATPLPAEAVFAVVVLLCYLGFPNEAMLIMMSFCGLLRIGEALTLTNRQVILPRTADEMMVCILLLARSKRGFDEKIVLSCKEVVTCLLKFRARFPGAPDDLFAPSSYFKTRRALLLALAVLNLVPPGTDVWRTHSLRRGGATALFELGVPFGSIQLYGRWASDKSCREYIRRGSTLLARLRSDTTVETWHKCKLLVMHFGQIKF